jgi:uracil-DNA glycosylase
MNSELLITDRHLSEQWNMFLSSILSHPDFKMLSDHVLNAYNHQVVYPPLSLLFNAFNACSPNDVKVVIIGQDPYHGPSQANGLAFSVHAGIKFPPSLKNIFKELSNDITGFEMPLTGDLSPWAKQGVLLINATLSVQAGLPGSHQKFGWEKFTNHVIQRLSDTGQNTVFLLWGQFAQSKSEYIDTSKHLVLKAAHPSPLARGAFFGCKHFSKTNDYLFAHGKSPIDWTLV